MEIHLGFLSELPTVRCFKIVDLGALNAKQVETILLSYVVVV